MLGERVKVVVALKDALREKLADRVDTAEKFPVGMGEVVGVSVEDLNMDLVAIEEGERMEREGKAVREELEESEGEAVTVEENDDPGLEGVPIGERELIMVMENTDGEGFRERDSVTVEEVDKLPVGVEQ